MRSESVTNLFIFEPHQQDLLHESQLGLLISLRALADIPRIECDLMSILGILIAGFGRAVAGIGSSWYGG